MGNKCNTNQGSMIKTIFESRNGRRLTKCDLSECKCFWLPLISNQYLKHDNHYGVEGRALISPVRTPKLQLAAEQPLTGECWIPPKKKIPHIQGQRRSPSEMAGGAKSCLETNPIPARDAQKSHPNPCIQQGTETPQETEADLPLYGWVSPVEAQISTGLPQGQELWLQRSWEARCGAKVLLEKVAISPTIEPPNRQPPNWKTIILKNFSHVEKILRPTTDPQPENPQGIWLWRPVGFDYRISTGLGKTLGRHKQNLVPTRNQKKGAEIPQETEPDLAVCVEESPAEAWVVSGLLWGQHWIQQSRNLKKSVQMVTVAMKLDNAFLRKKAMTNLDRVLKKQRHHFSNKGPYSQSYDFSSSQVQMWDLYHKDGWGWKNWSFSTVMLEKTWESLA